MEIKKDVTYLGKDFGQFRKNLIDFILNFASDEYNTKEDLYMLSIDTIEQLKIKVKYIKEYYNNN